MRIRAPSRRSRRLQALGAAHDLIVTVDCGTLSHDPITAAGCDVVVLDHHLGGETLPPALAVVNPNRQDEDSGLGHLCAASVVFLMLVEANRRLRAEGVQGPDLMALLDLVALATVADVAPLIGVNRGRKKALKSILKSFRENYVPDRTMPIAIMTADAEKDGDWLEAAIRKEEGCADVTIIRGSVGPTIGSHVGPGMVACAFWGKNRAEKASLSDRIARRVRGQ